MPLSRQAVGADRTCGRSRSRSESLPHPNQRVQAARERTVVATRCRTISRACRGAAWLWGCSSPILAVSFGAVGLGQLVAGGQPAPPSLQTARRAMARVVQPLPPQDESPLVLGTAGIGSVWSQLAQPVEGLAPSAPGEFAHAAPFSVVLAPPLRPNEAFGVVPYWALPDAAGLALKGLTTVVYAGLEVNPDGSMQTSGAAWDGYLSQDFMNLIDAAHADGARVVLGIQDFDQTSLNQLLASPGASADLAQSVLLLLKMRDLDGVNLDLEGRGSAGPGCNDEPRRRCVTDAQSGECSLSGDRGHQRVVGWNHRRVLRPSGLERGRSTAFSSPTTSSTSRRFPARARR